MRDKIGEDEIGEDLRHRKSKPITDAVLMKRIDHVWVNN